MPFLISSPLLDLSHTAGIDPRRLNAVVDRRLARGDDTRMRPGDYYPSLLRNRTGVDVRGISRASRHLLLDVESRQPLWRYTEYGRNSCELSVPGTIAATLQVALCGRPAASLVLTAGVIDAVAIGEVEADGAWTVARLRPSWHRFD